MNIELLAIDKKVKIKVYYFGSSPRFLLISGVHGDEKSGPLILRKLIEKLKKTRSSHSVAIIPIANPEAHKANSRVNPKDKVDLNRIFPVKKNKSHSYRIARVLQDFAKQFNIIIDFHVFTKKKTLICGIELRTGSKKVQSKIRKMMPALGAEAICLMDKKAEPKKGGSLAGYLQSLDKIAFGMELPPAEVLTKKQISDMVRNLARLITGKHAKQRIFLAIYTRQQFFSNKSGYFVPRKKIGQNIRKEDVVGALTSRGQKYLITSPFRGTLVSISYPRKIKKNDQIFVVGAKV